MPTPETQIQAGTRPYPSQKTSNENMTRHDSVMTQTDARHDI